MRLDKHILPIGLLVLELAYTLWFVFAGFGNHQDPLYWLYKYEHLEGGWMAVGTLLTGGAIVKLFGAQLLPLRLFGWLCTVTAILLPYCTMLTKEQRRDLINLFALPLTFLLMGYGAFQEFSPGTLTVLLLSLLWVTKSPIVLGLAVAARFPNILALLVLIPLWKKKNLWNIPIAAITAGVVYLLGYWFVTPAPLDSAMSSHDFGRMLTMLWENGGKLVGYILIAVGVLAIGNIQKTVKGIDLRVLSGLLVGGLLLYFIAYTIKPMQWYNTDLTYLLSALVIVFALASKQKELYIGAAIMAVATLGTDTAWLKLFPAAVCLLTVAATRYEDEMRRFLYPTFLGLTAAVMMRFSVNCVGDYNLRHCTVGSTVAPYEHIDIRPVDEEQLMQYKADFDSLSTLYTIHHTPILAFGQDLHRMRAVTGCQAARYNEFWSNIFDSVYTAKYREIIEAERPIVFCSFAPNFKTKRTYKDKHSALEEMLRAEGYCAIDRSKYKYMIYIYDPEIQ